jgi:NADH-quinone oxidoreductase subunit E
MTHDMTRIKEIIDHSSHQPGALIAVLQDIQREFRYLPREALLETASRLGVPLSKVYSVATFYTAFSLTPRGEQIVRVCQGTACQLKGADLILERFGTGLGIQPGETSADMKYTLEAVGCVGICAMAPVVIINDLIHGKVRPEKAVKLVKKD